VVEEEEWAREEADKEEVWDKEEADKDRESADHHPAYAQSADTQ